MTWQRLGGHAQYGQVAFDEDPYPAGSGSLYGTVRLDDTLSLLVGYYYPTAEMQFAPMTDRRVYGRQADAIPALAVSAEDICDDPSPVIPFTAPQAFRDGNDWLLVLWWTLNGTAYHARCLRLTIAADVATGELVATFVGLEPIEDWTAPGSAYSHTWMMVPFGPDRLVISNQYDEIALGLLTHDGTGGLTAIAPVVLDTYPIALAPGTTRDDSYWADDWRYAGWAGGDVLVFQGTVSYNYGPGPIGVESVLSAKVTAGVWALVDAVSVQNGPYTVAGTGFDPDGAPRAAFLAEVQGNSLDPDPDYYGVYAITGDVPAAGVQFWNRYNTSGGSWTFTHSGGLDQFSLNNDDLYGPGFAYVHPPVHDSSGWENVYLQGRCKHWGDRGGAAFRISPDFRSFWLIAKDGLYFVDGTYRELVHAWTVPMVNNDYWQVFVYPDGWMEFDNPHDTNLHIHDARNVHETRHGVYDEDDAADQTIFWFADVFWVGTLGYPLVLTVADADAAGTLTLRHYPEMSPPHGQSVGRQPRLIASNDGGVHVVAMDEDETLNTDLRDLYDLYLDSAEDISTSLLRTVDSNFDPGLNVGVGPTAFGILTDYFDEDGLFGLAWFDKGGGWLQVGTTTGLRQIVFTITGTVTEAASETYELRRDCTLVTVTVTIDGTLAGPLGSQDTVVFRVRRGSTTLAYGSLPVGTTPYRRQVALTVLVADLSAGDDIYVDCPHRGATTGPANVRITLNVRDR